ncbi:MAG TPA: site-specific integrase [Nocardioidaceae bacterium]|nr:site-specific integrase [Nocardioidaceae bacterium]
MANIQKRVGKDTIAWRARYRTPSGVERNKTFTRRVDAERFLAAIESSKNLGSYVDPTKSKLTVGEWAVRWLDHQAHLKPSTRERYAGILRQHVVPTWKSVRLGDVTHSDVQAWVTALSKKRSPATVRKVHRVLSLILDMAVKDGRLARNVARGVNLPRPSKEAQRYLTHDQVEALANECGQPAHVSKHRRHDERENETYRLVVLFLAYTGVRFGELAALRVQHLDLARRRARVVASVTVVQGFGLVWGTPKTHERREVPIPAFLVDDLARHVEGKSAGDLVFTGVRGGGPLRAAIFRRGGFDSAAAAIGLPGLHPHELRHTAASLAIAAGADVKVVQQMLGHSSATMTLDTYGHLFDDRLDEVGAALDAGRTAARSAARQQPDATVIDFASRHRGRSDPTLEL